MKKHFFYILALLFFFASCKQMDSEYKSFIEPNGITYLQKADSLKIYPGYYKIRLEWQKPKFPGVRYSMVYWNNYTDSIKVDLPQNSDLVTLTIENLEETSYSFNVKNFDDKGRTSIPVEITGTPYGDNYLLAATNRTYTTAIRNSQNVGTITWASKTSDLVYTEVRYQMLNNGYNIVRIPPSEIILNCPNIKPGEKFQYRSFFLPNGAVDTIAKDWVWSDKPFVYEYPRTGWTASSRNGNHAWGDSGGDPNLILDGKFNTGFHSTVTPLSPLPQCIVIDMKQSHTIDNIVITPHTTVSWRYIIDAHVYLSDQEIIPNTPQPSWGEPVAKATYVSGDNLTISLPTPKSGRYMAVVFPNSKSSTYISFMELNVFGY